ncbi:hypothetical protein V2I01_07825 [Micromonospora sp. BRA006-A]|nr:hypothetical protein [Micromonospora sp. BRA006-A]
MRNSPGAAGAHGQPAFDPGRADRQQHHPGDGPISARRPERFAAAMASSNSTWYASSHATAVSYPGRDLSVRQPAVTGCAVHPSGGRYADSGCPAARRGAAAG